MSEFYNTYAALVAHLQSTLPAEPSAEQQGLMEEATAELNKLHMLGGLATLQLALFDDVDALFSRPESLATLFNLDECGAAMAQHGIQTAVAFACDAAQLLACPTPGHH